MASMYPVDCHQTVEIDFHQSTYVLSISTANSSLIIEAEHKQDSSKWRGEFTSQYIEDITAKTGNFKKFPVFVKMLLSAVKHQSDSVTVDLLTYQDLELLKSRKGQGQQPLNKTIPPNNKRYLILTYAAEFDRVHYPLPLLFEDSADPTRLKAIIKKLRAEVEALKSDQSNDLVGSDSVRALSEENAVLRHKLRRAESWNDAGGQDQRLLKERDILRAKLEGMEAELERERGLHRRELRRKNKELDERVQELGKVKDQVQELRIRCKQLQQELENCNRRSSTASYRVAYGQSSRPSSRPPSQAPSRTGSRMSSRGASPASSRAPSPQHGYRGPSSGKATPEHSRPSSAASHRFDPTEYVKNKREKERLAIQLRSSRGTTPSRSAAHSYQSSPTVSRRHSEEDFLPGQRSSSMDRVRARSADGHNRPSSSTAAFHRSSTPPLRSTTPPHRSSNTPHRPSVRYPSAAPQQRSRTPSQQPSWSIPSVGGNKYPSAAERTMSPGKALQEVKARLHSFAKKQATGPGAGEAVPHRAAPVTEPPTRHKSFDDTSAEIADIDSRLHALQNFLKVAKANNASGRVGTPVA